MGFRPISKLFPYVDPLHEYEDSVLYGTKFAFWDKPTRDWIRPFVYGAAHSWLGWEGIPGNMKHRWQVEEYYDKLEYYKWKKLEDEAMGRGNMKAAKTYARFARKTMHGVNPFERELVVNGV